jgi:hypothetical protein
MTRTGRPKGKKKTVWNSNKQKPDICKSNLVRKGYKKGKTIFHNSLYSSVITWLVNNPKKFYSYDDLAKNELITKTTWENILKKRMTEEKFICGYKDATLVSRKYYFCIDYQTLIGALASRFFKYFEKKVIEKLQRKNNYYIRYLENRKALRRDTNTRNACLDFINTIKYLQTGDKQIVGSELVSIAINKEIGPRKHFIVNKEGELLPNPKYKPKEYDATIEVSKIECEYLHDAFKQLIDDLEVSKSSVYSLNYFNDILRYVLKQPKDKRYNFYDVFDDIIRVAANIYPNNKQVVFARVAFLYESMLHNIQLQSYQQ